MIRNPYKYREPLDPVKDKLVCAPRSEEVKNIITGIRRGDYWALLGPRQIGKTTLLHLIKNRLPHSHYIYCDFEDSYPEGKEDFYQCLRDKFKKEISSEKIENIDDKRKFTPELDFLEFLIEFRPEDNARKIILLFDNIDEFPFLNEFLHLWRAVYHRRYHEKKLNRYIVIVTGSVNLIEVTSSPNSPFNVAEIFYVKDFSNKDIDKLISEPINLLNIKIKAKAKENLEEKLSGHPQILQHACHILVDMAIASQEDISEKDVENAINVLFASNQSLDKLMHDLTHNEELHKLAGSIIRGAQKKYFPNKKFSILGAGAIIERDTFCDIRNNLYREFIKGILENMAENSTASSILQYQPLKEKLLTDQELVDDYENHRLSEKNFYGEIKSANEILRIKNAVAKHQDEYSILRDIPTSGHYDNLLKGLHEILKSLEWKIDLIIKEHLNLHDGLFKLQMTVVGHFEESEKNIIAAILEKLDRTQTELVRQMMEFIDKEKLSKDEMAGLLVEMEDVLKKIQGSLHANAENSPIKDTESILGKICDPKLDIRHRLKVTLPVIPFLLSYEGEIEEEIIMKLKNFLKKLTKKRGNN